MVMRPAILGLLLSSALLTAATLFVLPVVVAQDGATVTFTPEQLEAIAQKRAAAAAAGIVYSVPSGIPGDAGAADPVTPYTATVTTTKADLLASWQQQYDEMVGILGADRVAQIDSYEGWRFNDALAQIQALPDGPVELPIAMTLMGMESAKFFVIHARFRGVADRPDQLVVLQRRLRLGRPVRHALLVRPPMGRRVWG